MSCNSFSGKNVYALSGVETTFNTPATTIDKPIALIQNINWEWFNKKLLKLNFQNMRKL